MKSTSKKTTVSAMYGQQNENIILSLQTAYSTVLNLVQNGFTVLDICVRNSRPVIKIQNCAKCATLTSSTSVFSRDSYGTKRRKVSLINSTQVEWVVRGH